MYFNYIVKIKIFANQLTIKRLLLMKILLLLIIFFVPLEQSANSQSDIPNKTLEQLAGDLMDHFKYDSAAYCYGNLAEQYEQGQNWMQSIRNYRLASDALLKAAMYENAFKNSQKALMLAKEHVNTANKDEVIEKSDILISMADVNERTEQFDQELSYCKKALDLTLETDSLDELRIASIWGKIGTAYNNLSKYDSALYFCNKALNLRVQLLGEKDIRIGSNLFLLGYIYESNREYDKALESYYKALQLYISLNRELQPVVGMIYLCIGNVLSLKNKPDEALDYYRKALDIQTSTYKNQHPDLALTYYNAGRVYLEKGEYDEALKYFYKSLQIENAFCENKSSKQASTYYSIGVIHYYKGEYEKALEFQQKAIWIAVRGPNYPYLAISYAGIGLIYRSKEKFDEAINYFQKALTTCLSAFGENHPYIPFIYNCIGASYWDNNKDLRALDYFQKALNLWTSIDGKDPYVTIAYNNIASIYSYQGEYDKALSIYQKVLLIRIANYGNHHPYLAVSYNYLGGTYSKKGEFFKALQFYQKALIANTADFADTSVYVNPKLVNILSESDLLQTLFEKANILYQISKAEPIPDSTISLSLSTYELAFQLINIMRNKYTREDSKLLLSQNTKTYYAQAMHVAKELAKVSPECTTKAIELIEKGKSATLAIRFNDLDAKYFAAIPHELLEKEKDLQSNINSYNIKITKDQYNKDGYDTLKINTLKNKKFVLACKLDSLLNYYETQFPLYYQYKYSNKIVPIENFQKVLDKKTAIIDYFLGDSTLFIAVFTDNLSKLEEIKISKTFEETVLRYSKKLKSADPEALLSISHQLYQKLIQPVKKHLAGKDNLIIIPDDFLYYIPFETLVENPTSSKLLTEDYSKADYLIKNYSISYHHSLSLWYNSKKREKQYTLNHQLNFIGFAPVFDKKQNNGEIRSGNVNVLDTTSMNLSYRSISSDLKSFKPLPFSKDEVTEIVHLFKQRQKEAKAFLYSDANEANFKKYAENFSIVHVSSHGFSNDKEPALSGLAFSQPTDTSVKEDGILYAGEAYNLNLNADLIVLSACESGLGKLIKGEGIQALSRGFLFTGVPNIIFTLWNAQDKATKVLMVKFYLNFLEGKTYSEALREAKLSLIRDPHFAFPHIWGMFILVGR